MVVGEVVGVVGSSVMGETVTNSNFFADLRSKV